MAAMLLGLPAGAADTGCAAVEGKTHLKIDVTGVRSASGNVNITVYPDDSGKFLGAGAKVARLRVPAASPVTVGCIALPAPGFYAIALYHDENGDRKFNRTLVGLPDEGYGFSNDAPAIAGLPSFDSVRFQAGKERTDLTITLRY